jgi:phosphatidylglycerophosphatase A
MKFWRFVASGFGAGYAPKAPGTFGSLVGLALGVALLLAAGHVALLAGIVLASAAGLYATRVVGCAAEDPGWIVIDEIAGQMLAMMALSRVSVLGLVLAFGLFRLFDIWKPGPVGWADAQHDEWGLMGDDMIAGLMAAGVLLLIRVVVPL